MDEGTNSFRSFSRTYTCDDDSNWRIVRLQESDETLINPGRGFSTYQRFNGDPIEKTNAWNDDGPIVYRSSHISFSNDSHPDTASAYLRWYWARIEKEEGRYRWDIIDRAIEEAGRRGQQLHIRIMPHDAKNLLPEWYTQKGKLITSKIKSTPCYIPDYDDPLFQKSMERLVGEMGARYDGHPNLHAVDIGTLGFWGEWHAANFHPLYTEGERYFWAVDLYLQAFRKTPLLMLISPSSTFRYAIERGAGWRADCWGDVWPRAWEHMTRFYPWCITNGNAVNAWRKAPVCLETCWTFVFWFEKGWDVDYILEEALRWHASLINAKSGMIPEPWMEKVIEFEKKLGYRYVLRTAEFPASLSIRNKLNIRHWWLNHGVAPCYEPFCLCFRLSGPDQIFSLPSVHDLRCWLPGDDQCNSDAFELPADIVPGVYELQVGICRTGTSIPAVKTANKARTKEGWIPIGEICLSAN